MKKTVKRLASVFIIFISILLIFISSLFLLLPKDYLWLNKVNTEYFMKFLKTEEEIKFVSCEYDPYYENHHVEVYYESGEDEKIILNEKNDGEVISFIENNTVSNRFFGVAGIIIAIVLLLIQFAFLAIWLIRKIKK